MTAMCVLQLISEFEWNPAGLLRQQAALGPFQRTQVEILHPKFHRDPGPGFQERFAVKH